MSVRPVAAAAAAAAASAAASAEAAAAVAAAEAAAAAAAAGRRRRRQQELNDSIPHAGSRISAIYPLPPLNDDTTFGGPTALKYINRLRRESAWQ